ncbi:hypothetical protein RFI_30021 [Reticulomyxa filosa]|uniref:Uncharacterized protein n=1 Tax=Reticulomyxa filosa TaxID=46433 RepID=X6M304_RETFI|nr:hypothetical protein RFI_30021 [Reticulomyxa filosa]|eukprot:ETO07370.1 hypothetical protein RFI_30021 [Reticulomyxa filosa]
MFRARSQLNQLKIDDALILFQTALMRRIDCLLTRYTYTKTLLTHRNKLTAVSCWLLYLKIPLNEPVQYYKHQHQTLLTNPKRSFIMRQLQQRIIEFENPDNSKNFCIIKKNFEGNMLMSFLLHSKFYELKKTELIEFTSTCLKLWYFGMDMFVLSPQIFTEFKQIVTK